MIYDIGRTANADQKMRKRNRAGAKADDHNHQSDLRSLSNSENIINLKSYIINVFLGLPHGYNRTAGAVVG
jgi:hypothetical protein